MLNTKPIKKMYNDLEYTNEHKNELKISESEPNEKTKHNQNNQNNSDKIITLENSKQESHFGL